MRPLTRRALALAGLGGACATLAGCAAMRGLPVFGTLLDDGPVEGTGPVTTPDYDRIYGRVAGERFPVPAFDYTNIDPAYLRAEIAFAGREPVGSLVIDPRRHVLYLVGERGRATRYGIAVGREAVGFSGTGTVAGRAIWPGDAPSAALAEARTPSFFGWAQLATGRTAPIPAEPAVRGGSRSLRGARALYLATQGRDAGFAIHGTPAPASVGTDVTSGCIALIDQDVIDLYARVGDGAPVAVLA